MERYDSKYSENLYNKHEIVLAYWNTTTELNWQNYRFFREKVVKLFFDKQENFSPGFYSLLNTILENFVNQGRGYVFSNMCKLLGLIKSHHFIPVESEFLIYLYQPKTLKQYFDVLREKLSENL